MPKCPQCRAETPKYDHKLDCTDPSRYLKEERMKPGVHDLSIPKIFLRACNMGDELNLSAIIDDADSDRAVAFEVASVLALGALVAVDSMTKDEAVRSFSSFYDHVKELSKKKDPSPDVATT